MTRRIIAGVALIGVVGCGGRVDTNPGSAGLNGNPIKGPIVAPPDDDPVGTDPGRVTPTQPADGACWFGQVPEVQPILPKMTVAQACAVTSWSTDPIGNMATGDARAKIVGRWMACGKGELSALPHAGIEFGANGRWRLLTTDASGALVPMTSMSDESVGRYSALASGQLNIGGETSGHHIVFTKYSSSMDAFQVEESGGPTSIYARTDPSPNNGRDNLPSLTDGACSMVGTWDVPAGSSAPAATFSFDALGNFVGGAQGSDLCSGHMMYGTYQLFPGTFQITSNLGMGLCSFWFDAGYTASFEASCTKLTIQTNYDNCTGGRGYFNERTTLTKR